VITTRLQNRHHVTFSDRNTTSLGAGNHRLPDTKTLSESRLSEAGVEPGHTDIVRDTVCYE
jgi:hypothetical protein